MLVLQHRLLPILPNHCVSLCDFRPQKSPVVLVQLDTNCGEVLLIWLRFCVDKIWDGTQIITKAGVHFLA